MLQKVLGCIYPELHPRKVIFKAMTGQIHPITFKERIIFLCDHNGISAPPEKLPRILAKKLIKEGVVEYNGDIDELEKLTDRIRKRIADDINKDPDAIPYYRIKWYCDLFGCSADYLLGYIDTPTYEEKSIHVLTGLSLQVAETLSKQNPDIIDALNFLIPDADIKNQKNSPLWQIEIMKESLLCLLKSYLYEKGRVSGVYFDGTFHERKGSYSGIGIFRENSDPIPLSPYELQDVQMITIQRNLQQMRIRIQEAEANKESKVNLM